MVKYMDNQLLFFLAQKQLHIVDSFLKHMCFMGQVVLLKMNNNLKIILQCIFIFLNIFYAFKKNGRLNVFKVFVCLYILNIYICSCGSVVEHCVSSTKGCGFKSQATHILIKNV